MILTTAVVAVITAAASSHTGFLAVGGEIE